MDYDETPEGDEETMITIEKQLNAGKSDPIRLSTTEYGAAIGSSTKIKTKQGLCQASNIKIGDILSTGSTVVGVIRKKITEYDTMKDGTEIALSTMYWDEEEQRWRRWIQTINLEESIKKEEKEFCSFVVVPNSQLELENGMRIRDYMEWCSPDAENIYSQKLEKISELE